MQHPSLGQSRACSRLRPAFELSTHVTSAERKRLRSDLVKFAADDARITGAAVTGSAADSREDKWSDIDLAFGVRTAANVPNVLSDWTSHLYDRHRALHHVDTVAGAWTYRTFLLPNTLQVDLALSLRRNFAPWRLRSD